MKERWRPVKGYEGYYEVSDHGRVKSLARHVPRGGGSLFVAEKILALGFNKSSKVAGNRYYQITLCGPNGKRMWLVHRLVATAFLKSPKPGQDTVLHKDDNPSNNHYKNLKWGTVLDNNRDMALKGRTLKGERRPGSKLTEKEVRRIAKRLKQGAVQDDLAAEFAVSQAIISRIKYGHAWSHVTGIIR